MHVLVGCTRYYLLVKISNKKIDWINLWPFLKECLQEVRWIYYSKFSMVLWRFRSIINFMTMTVQFSLVIIMFISSTSDSLSSFRFPMTMSIKSFAFISWFLSNSWQKPFRIIKHHKTNTIQTKRLLYIIHIFFYKHKKYGFIKS